MKKLLILIILLIFISCSRYKITYEITRDSTMTNSYSVHTQVRYTGGTWAYGIYYGCVPEDKVESTKKQHKEMIKIKIGKFKERLKRK